LSNRHAQLGTFDLQATSVELSQVGYKLLMNTQCTGLTTRFAINPAVSRRGCLLELGLDVFSP